MSAASVQAAEPTVAELQAEIERLRQALAAAQGGQQAAPAGGAAPATAPASPAADSAAGTAAQAAAEAPQELDAVVVRSRNRIERLQDVPLSVSVVTGRELERLSATDVSDIVKRAGNVSWNRGNQRTSSLSIRGIGKVGQTEAQDPSVGLIVDGINYAYNALSSSFDFTDVEAVEVTRGPQGTLLGKNTSLGVINITTRKPSFTPSADWSLTFGQRDTVIGTLAAGGPVIDDLLAWRGVLSVSRGKGDIENAYNRNITYQNRDRISGRAQFLFTPTADFNARFGFDVQPRASETTNGRTIYTPTPATYANGAPNTALNNETRLGRRWFTQYGGYSVDDYLYGGGRNEVNNNDQRGLVTGSHGAFAELNWKLGDYSVTSITGYKDYHFNAVNDEGTPFDVYRNSGGFWNDYKQISQEVRLSSPVGGFVDYQTGLYFMKVHNEADYRRLWGNDAGAWFATNGQYSTLDRLVNPDGSLSAGRELLRQSLANLSMSYNSPSGKQDIRNRSAAIFGQANWHFTDRFTLTTGLRLTRENRRTYGESGIKDNGNAPELNPDLVGSTSLGGFASNASTGALDGTNTAEQLALADSVATKYFGVAATGTPGQAYNSLTADQRRQVAAAKAIRRTAIGTVFPRREAEAFEDTQPSYVISPSYKFNENLTGYVSLQYGEKAGISQFLNGESYLVKPEKTTSYEVGLKSVLLDKTLVLNADVFLTRIKDYQQSVRVFDQYLTGLNGENTYSSVTGNVPKVQASGLEIDGVYSGLRNTTIRFSGAYNKAVYKEFANSAQPSESANAADPYRDVTGQAVAGAPKYSFNIGVDWRLPIWNDKELHTSANVAYTSRFNSDNALSSYGWIPDSSVTDFAIGLGKRDKSFDVSLVVKNLFDDKTPQSRTWNSYVPAVPRWAGIVFTGKL